MTQPHPRGDIATDLLLDLERRLHRAEFYISGAHEPQDVPRELKPSVYKRLQTLEQKLRKLTSVNGAYADLLKLCQYLLHAQWHGSPADKCFFFRS